MDKFHDLEPQKDPKGGAPTSSPSRKTPRPIPVSEFGYETVSMGPQHNEWHLPAKEIIVWAFRSLVVLGFLWMRATFVTNDKYDADKGKTLQELMTISNTLTRIDEKLSKGVDVDIDHEKRLRELEHGKPAQQH